MSGRVRRRIVAIGVQEYLSHRGDFETCPNCDHRMDCKEWDKVAHTLVIEPRCYKAGAVATIAECPKCFTDSWVHEPMDSFGYGDWPDRWKKAVIKRTSEVKLSALRAWGAALCHRCAHLTSGTVVYHAWRDCIIGSGPALTMCARFSDLTGKDDQLP